MNFYGTSDSDYGNVLTGTPDGGYALINQVHVDGELLSAFIKTDCNGAIEWTKTYRFPSDWSIHTTCYNLATVGSGYLMVLGFRESGTGHFMSAAVMLDNAGNIVWSRTLPLQVAFNSGGLYTNDHDFVICGNPNNFEGSLSSTALVKMDYNGNLLDTARIELPGATSPVGITRLANGNYVIAATFPSVISSFIDIAVTTVDADFNPVKAVVYDTYYDDQALGIASEGNNVYICGHSYFIDHAWDGMILKFNEQLNLVFANYYESHTPYGEVFRDIIHTRENRMVVCGDLGGFEERDPLLLGIDVSGNVSFSKRYPVSPMFTNYLFSVVQVRDGGLATTGDIRPPFMFRDAPIIKTNMVGEETCYAENFGTVIYRPAATVVDTPVQRLIFDPAITNNEPEIKNVPIHQVQDCNLSSPCPDFWFQRVSECPDRCFDFYDLSTNGISWYWEFEGASPSTSTEQHPTSICYPKNGKYKAKLTVTNPFGNGTVEKEMDVYMECNPVFPNIITPNLDGINEEFIITMLPREYTLHIFDRWGIQITKIKQGDKPWRGRDNNGNRVSQGVYFYSFVNDISGEEYKGFVQVSY